MTDLLNIIVDDFGIRLLDYRIEFSGLYIFHQGIISEVVCGYAVQMNFYFLF